MSNVGYDLDTSGGLMPLIRALIKPPDEEGNGQKAKKSQHPYYKRPGKGHNHDSCDACGEGGDLICCDRCPASFHLGCYDPPLDENDIPVGLWLCRECRASDAEQPTSSRGSRAVSPADNKSDTEKKTRSLRTRSNSKKRSRDNSDEEEKGEEADKEKEVESELSPMQVLVKAAKIMNPRQFELPKQMQIPCIFPGTDKVSDNGKNGSASVVTTDAWGCVPLPAKACYVCLGTCKQAPLLQCDYCPLLFHQDCLDPPLTALPTGRWMCPNHVEKYIDWKLVNSVSLTERAALWERFSAPVDQHAIKIDFIRRARKYKPMFRLKVPAWCRGRVCVPDMVRRHYARPPPLMPSRRDTVRCRTVLKRLKNAGVYSESEDEDAPKHTICLNLSCPEYRSEGLCPHSLGDQEDQGDTGDEGPQADVGDKTDDEDKAADPLKSEPASDSSSSLSELGRAPRAAKRRRRAAASPPRARLAAAADALLAAADHQLRRIDNGLVKILAWQRLQQVLWGEVCAGSFRRAALGAAAERAVRRALPAAAGAASLPSDLLSRADRERIAAAVWGAPPPPSAWGAPSSNTPWGAPPSPPPPPARGDRAVRAALCPTRNGGSEWTGRAIPMRLATLRVGADSGCDVRLGAACRAVAGYHAVIFVDEVSRHFELINYSEHGSVVNGVRYACDVTRSADDVTRGASDVTGSGEREAALRDVVRRRMPKPHRINGDVTSPSPSATCRCAPAAAGGAWEGSALVPHGALLQFGCYQFVFSITDHLGEDDLEPAL